MNQKESTNEEIELQQHTLDQEQKQSNKLKQIEMKIESLIQYLKFGKGGL